MNILIKLNFIVRNELHTCEARSNKQIQILLTQVAIIKGIYKQKQ